MEVASEYFRSGADKISIGSDAVYAAEEYLRTGVSVISIICFEFTCVHGRFTYMVLEYLLSGKDWKEQLGTDFYCLWKSGE